MLACLSNMWACRAQYLQPPEALNGCKLDMKSNVYAFGMLIYELLLRKEPYQDEDQAVPPYQAACCCFI